MAIRPTLNLAVQGTQINPNPYNENFDMMLDYIDDTIIELNTYVVSQVNSISNQVANNAGNFQKQLTNKADISFSNITAEARKMFFPDYTKAVVKAWNTEHVAESNGWIYIFSLQANASAEGTLTIDGMVVHRAYCHSDTQIRIGSIVPIAKGSKYKATGGYSDQQLKFIPQTQPSET